MSPQISNQKLSLLKQSKILPQLEFLSKTFKRTLSILMEFLKNIKKNIDLYVELGTTSRRVSGKLLGYNSGYIIQTTNGIQIFNKIAGI
jgi:hypothetical protein